MDTNTIRDLHGYDGWATNRVLECAAALSTGQFVATDDTPWGSIRNQFVHQLIVHRRWLSWADGTMSGEEAYRLSVEMEDYPDIASVRAMWVDVRDQTRPFLERMTMDDLERDLTVDTPGYEFSIPVGQVMIHIALHSMQHRTETTVALTRLGQSPGDLDYLFYMLEQGASSTV